MHRILATNKFLFKLNIAQSEMCTFCHSHPETILHLFLDCEYVENLWKRLEQWIFEKCGTLYNLSKMDILFGKSGSKFNALNLIILLTKQFIYRKRFKQEQINFESLKCHIFDYYSIEKYIYRIKGNSNLFHRKWQRLEGLF